MSNELNILLANIAACGQRIRKLTYSLNKNREIFPITLARVEALTDDRVYRLRLSGHAFATQAAFRMA